MPKDIKWPRLLFWVGLSLAAGGISAWLTSGSMDVYSALVPKPPLAPPPIAFPIAWSILYVLMGIAAYLVSVSRGKKRAGARPLCRSAGGQCRVACRILQHARL